MRNHINNFLQNNCTREDFAALLRLVRDPKREVVLNREMEEDWEKRQDESDTPDLKSTLHRIHYEINRLDRGHSAFVRSLNVGSRVAAILFVPLLLVSSYLFFADGRVVAQTVSTPLASQTSFLLPDGTQVWLNAGSTLIFPSQFKGSNRNVELEGEAYFDVVKDSKPFVVQTSKLNVEVLGTAFNVMAYDGEVPAITLDRGLVRLSSATMAQQLLKPGFQALLDTLDREISISEVDTELYSCWRDHRLVFRNEPLKSVIVKLERWYNVEIEIADSSLLANKVTADIESESVKEVMDLMQVTMPIECSYNKDERKLIIQKH